MNNTYEKSAQPLRKHSKTQSGYALVVALLLIALFAVVVGEFVRNSYVEGIAAENRLQLCATKLALDGAEERALALILQQFQEVRTNTTNTTIKAEPIDLDNFILYGCDWNESYEENCFSITRGSGTETFKCKISIRISDESTRIPLKILDADINDGDASTQVQNSKITTLFAALQQNLNMPYRDVTAAIIEWEKKKKRKISSPFELLSILNNNSNSAIDENRYLVFGGIDNSGNPFPGLAEFISTDYEFKYQPDTANTPQSFIMLKGYACSELMVQTAYAASKELNLTVPDPFSAKDYTEKKFGERAHSGVSLLFSYSEYNNKKENRYFSDFYRVEITATCGSATSSRTIICRRYTHTVGDMATGSTQKYIEVVNRQPVRCFTDKNKYPDGYIPHQMATRRQN